MLVDSKEMHHVNKRADKFLLIFPTVTLDVQVRSKRQCTRRKALCSDLRVWNVPTEPLLPSVWTCTGAAEFALCCSVQKELKQHCVSSNV